MPTNTQEKIIKLIEVEKETLKKKRKKSWNKYYGDVCCRIFREFLLKEIPKKYTISSPNAYIKGYPTEFDLLIVDRNVKPEKYTNAFKPEKVKFGLEIKAHGLFVRREDLKKAIKKIKKKFEEIKKSHPSINFLYITYEEVCYPKKKGSINYLDETRKILKSPYEVFCFKDSRTGKVIQKEWLKLISHLNKNLP